MGGCGCGCACVRACVRARVHVCHCSVVVCQAGEKFTVYPKHAAHEAISRATLTPTAALLDALSMASCREEACLIQALSKLERCMICLGTGKSLSREEDRLLEVEDKAILQVDFAAAKLGPSLCELNAAIKELMGFVSTLPGADLEKPPFIEYNFTEVTNTLRTAHEAELEVALNRWNDVLTSSCTQIATAFPEGWQAKAIDSYDIEFIKTRILSQTLIDKMGSDFHKFDVWLRSMEKNTEMYEEYKKRHEKDLQSNVQIIADAVAMTATILAYNTMVFKWPKMGNNERRQGKKDLVKKIKLKLGKWAELPAALNDRMTAAISGKSG